MFVISSNTHLMYKKNPFKIIFQKKKKKCIRDNKLFKPKSAWNDPFPLAGSTNNTPVLAYLASIVIFGILTLPSNGAFGRILN